MWFTLSIDSNWKLLQSIKIWSSPFNVFHQSWGEENKTGIKSLIQTQGKSLDLSDLPNCISEFRKKSNPPINCYLYAFHACQRILKVGQHLLYLLHFNDWSRLKVPSNLPMQWLQAVKLVKVFIDFQHRLGSDLHWVSRGVFCPVKLSSQVNTPGGSAPPRPALQTFRRLALTLLLHIHLTSSLVCLETGRHFISHGLT